MFTKIKNWTLDKLRRFKKWVVILFIGAVALGATLITDTAITISLEADVKSQIQEWLNETNGLNELLDPAHEFMNDSDNFVARASQGGLSNYQFALYQKEYYDFVILNEGLKIDSTEIKTEWRSVMNVIIQSYNEAPDYEYEISPSKGTITRSKMNGYFGEMKSYVVKAEKNSILFRIAFAQQVGVPTSDGTNDWMELNGDGDGDAFDELDEGITGTDDATTAWDESADLGIIETSGFGLTDPSSSAGHIVRTRNRKHATGGQQIDIIIGADAGGILFANNQTRFVDVDATWTTRTHTLSGTQADLITDYSALQVVTQDDEVGGGSPKNAQESTHEFEVPSAGPPVTASPSFGGPIFFD